MCVIIDTNALNCVFRKSSREHRDFAPVLNWIVYGSGIIVFGGTKYINELKNTRRYLRLILELNKCDKAFRADDASVDCEETKIKKNYTEKGFNDHHLAALVIVTKCKIICTKDKAAIPYLKNIKLYPRGICKPIFYTSIKNRSILNDQNIAVCCKPCFKMKKSQLGNLKLLLN